MKIKTRTHNQNINFNLSFFYFLKAKLYQKFNLNTKDDDKIKILDQGIDEFNFVKTNSNKFELGIKLKIIKSLI